MQTSIGGTTLGGIILLGMWTVCRSYLRIWNLLHLSVAAKDTLKKVMESLGASHGVAPASEKSPNRELDSVVATV